MLVLEKRNGAWTIALCQDELLSTRIFPFSVSQTPGKPNRFPKILFPLNLTLNGMEAFPPAIARNIPPSASTAPDQGPLFRWG